MVQQLTYGKSYAAIEHAEKKQFHYLQLTKKKNEFIISKQQESNSFEGLLEELKSQKHLFLIVNDEQVLSKKITTTTSDENSIVRTAFPNITISDFYYEIHTESTTTYIAIARKDVVDKIIAQHKKIGVTIIDFSLGNLAVKNLNSLVRNKIIHSSNAIIQFDEKSILDIKKGATTNEKYTVNDLKVSNTELLPLSGIIGYYSKNTSSSIQNELKESYLQKRFFDLGLKAGLGFLLVVLLINFLFFNNYRDQVGNLTGELQLSATYKNQLSKLQKEVTQKKRLVQSVNSASNSKLSKYIDELGISVPNTILLTQINYQPINGIVRVDKQLIFDAHKMILKGTSKNDENFSNWISVLEKKDWVQNISISEYGKGKKTNSIANFEFIITTND